MCFEVAPGLGSISVFAGQSGQLLGDQQRVMDTLAAHSIKHESEIKDFKHILKNQ